MAKENVLIRNEIGTLFSITLALHHMNKSFERQFGLSLVQLYTLIKLRELPAVTLNTLASEVGVQPSTLTQTIRRLGRKSFVLVIEDPTDSRKKLISITREGKEAIEFVCEELVEVFPSRSEGKASATSKEASAFLEVAKTILHRSSLESKSTICKGTNLRVEYNEPELSQ